MIDGLKPYPAMKDSSVPWLGDVPEHWEIRRIKTLFHEKDERNGSRSGTLLSLTRARGIVPQAEASKRIASAENLSKYKVCGPGDLVMNRMQAWSGMFALSSHEGVVSPDYSVFVGIGTSDAKYFEYLFKTPILVHQFAQRSKGIGSGFNRLYTDDFGAVQATVPPLPEQSAIVRFLDHADRGIRRAIRAKQKLIALLNEQNQAIIHQAVTRGLDPRVRLRRTGNDWFPETPEHWDVLPMRRVIRRAVDGPHHSPSYLDNGVPFLSARNIKVDRWSLDDAKFISETDFEEFCKRVTPEIGDVLYTKGGTTGVARAVDLEFRFQVWVHVAVLKLNNKKVTPDYLATTLNTPRCYEQSQLFTRGATNQDLGLGRMKDIVLPVPPLSEQDAIIKYVTTATDGLQQAIDRAHREISLLREYRTRLIADVVTGKLDVREVAARLPEETEELEPLDEADALDEGDEEAAETDLDTALEEATA